MSLSDLPQGEVLRMIAEGLGCAVVDLPQPSRATIEAVRKLIESSRGLHTQTRAGTTETRSAGSANEPAPLDKHGKRDLLRYLGCSI